MKSKERRKEQDNNKRKRNGVQRLAYLALPTAVTYFL